MGHSVHSEQHSKKYHQHEVLGSSIFASPIDLTPEVALATEQHLAAHAAATAGEHAVLAPAQVASAYLSDAEDVAAAKAEFEKLFKAAEAGTPIVPAIPALPVAPIAHAVLPGHVYGNYYGNYFGGYPGYAGLVGSPYQGVYNSYYGHPGYAGLGYLPYQLTAPAVAAEEKSE